MNDILRILVAPLLWLASFSAVYGLHGLGCALAWPAGEVLGLSLFRAVLLVAWLAALAAQVALLVALRSSRFASPAPFARWISLATAWVGLVATAWTLHPIVLTSACDFIQDGFVPNQGLT